MGSEELGSQPSSHLEVTVNGSKLTTLQDCHVQSEADAPAPGVTVNHREREYLKSAARAPDVRMV